MSYRILYGGAVRYRGRWLPKLAYIRNGIPLILEGDPDCAYTSRGEALAHVDELKQYLRRELGEPEGSPSDRN